MFFSSQSHQDQRWNFIKPYFNLIIKLWMESNGWKVNTDLKKRNIIFLWFVTRYNSFCFIIKFLNIILKKKNNLEIFLYLFWSDMIFNVTIFNVYLAEAWRAESPDPLQAWDVWWLLLTLQEHHQELNRRVRDRTKDQHQVYPESLYRGLLIRELWYAAPQYILAANMGTHNLYNIGR